jgi:hypothetical protein
MAETSDNGRQPSTDSLASFPAPERDALGHPFRREILRALGRETAQLSPAELADSGLLPCSAGCAAYHLQVLAHCGLAAGVESEVASDGVAQRFTSLIEDGDPALAILRETTQSDRRHLAPASS